MKEQLVLQKETIHRLGGSSQPALPQQDASRGANPAAMNVERSFFTTFSILTD